MAPCRNSLSVPTKEWYLQQAKIQLFEIVLTDLLQVLNSVEVPVILLKGAALRQTVYSDPGAREMGDIDIWVQPQHLDTVVEVLREAGFTYNPEPLLRRNPFNTSFTGEVGFIKNTIIIDLHTELIPIEWFRKLFRINSRLLWRDAQPVNVGMTQAYQLNVVDTLIHLCLHLAIHNYAHPVGYIDVIQVIKSKDIFPWREFLDRVNLFCTRVVIYFPLEAIRSVKPELIPQFVIDEMCPSRIQRILVNRVADPFKGMVGNLKSSHERAYLLHILVVDTFAQLVSMLKWLFFPGVTWLRVRYQLKSIQAYLACFWHPLFVIYHGFLAIRLVVLGDKTR